MKIKKHIYVISCGISPSSLSEDAMKIISTATVISGGKRLLGIFAKDSQKQIVIASNALETLQELIELSNNNNVVILASGDALFHGIGNTLGTMIDNESYTIIPNITAFQELCARLKLPWSDFQLFSIHGKNGVVPWRSLLSSEKSIIYCDNKMSASGLAKKLIAKHSHTSQRIGVSCANLGMENEVIHHGTLEELSSIKLDGLSILMLLGVNRAKVSPVLPLGLSDDHYKHESNLITHPEVRTIILSKLALRGGVMWDLGAGSGSVGLEAAGMCGNLDIYAVEKSKNRVNDIICNEANEGIENHHVVLGNILEEISRLPKPDIIFIGGGGKDIEEIAEKAFKNLNKGGRMVISAVTLETISSINSILNNHVKEVLSIGVSRSKSVGNLTMMKPENPIHIFVFEK